MSNPPTENKPYKVELRVKGKPIHGKRVMVKWPGWKHPLTLDILVRTRERTEGEPVCVSDYVSHYEVSWSSLGACSAQLARRYATAINIASTEADLLTAKFKGKVYR